MFYHCDVLMKSDRLFSAFSVCFGFVNNAHYQRMKALQKMVGLEFRQDISGGGLANWIGDGKK